MRTTENLLHDPATDRWVLIDFDHAAQGPRELDLLFAVPDHFQEPAAARDSFTRAYGYDLLHWPGWITLRDISKAHSLASYIRRAPTAPAAAAELAHRLHSLRVVDRGASVAGVVVADLLGLILVLAAAYGVVLGVMALVTGWQVLCHRQPHRERRGVVVAAVGATELAVEGARS